MKKIKNNSDQKISNFNFVKYRKSLDMNFNIRRELLISDFNEWIKNLYASMHLSKFRQVLYEIETIKHKFISIPEHHWRYQIIQIRAIVRIIRKKLKKYHEFLPNDNSHQNHSLSFWFNQIVLILEQLCIDFRLDTRPNKNQKEFIKPIRSIYHGYIELISLLIRFSYIKGEFHEVLSYLSISEGLANYANYIVNINSMSTLQRIFLVKTKIFMANCDYLNASRYLEKTIDFSLSQLNFIVDYRLNLETIDQDQNTLLTLFEFDKKRINSLKNILINVIIDFYLRGVLSELLGSTEGAIDSYKQSKFFATKFFKNKFFNYTMFFYHLQNNGYKYLAVMDELKQYREEREKMSVIQNREMIRKKYLKKLKYERNYDKYYSTMRVKNDLYKGRLKNFLDRENIKTLKEEKNRQGILSKFSKTKFITSTINLLNIYLAKDFKENLKKMEKIEISKYPKEANDYLSNILYRKSHMLKENKNETIFSKTMNDYNNKAKSNNNDNNNINLNLMNNSVSTINKKDLLCKSTQDKLNRINIRYNLFNINRTNNINKYRNNIHNNIIKNNYKLSSSTSVKNIFSDKRTTNDSTNNTRFLRKGINSSFTSAVNSVNNDFRVNILQSAKSTKNIFLKYTRDSPLISPRNIENKINMSFTKTKEISKDNNSFSRKSPLLRQLDISNRIFKLKIKPKLRTIKNKIIHYKINKDYLNKSLINKRNLIEKYSNEEIKFHQKLLRTKICEIEPYKEEKFDFDLRKIESNAKETYDRIFELCRASIGRKNLDQYYKSIKLITGETNKEEKKTKYKKRNAQAYNTKDDFDLNKIYIDNNLSQLGKTYILNNNKQKIKVLENEYDILTSRESKIIDLKKQFF